MPSPIPGSLSNKNEDIVRKLFKTLRATKFEDPLDQDSFLVESATTVLEFRPQIASFALVPDLGECIFLIRSMMHANNARLDTPPSDTFTSIQDFAGEIVHKRQTLRERKRANLERALVAEGAAARLERKAALEHAAKVTDSQGPRSSADDVVSIPSSEDKAEPVFSLKNPPPSPISVNLTNVAPCSKAALSVITKSIPTGPHAGLRSEPASSSRKRRRTDEGENDDPQAVPVSRGRSDRPMQHLPHGPATIWPTTSGTEEQLHARLVVIQAEARRLANDQK
ncbi:hypothetical protein K438DRAFT_1770219 [Mycena galopus ATCC 62051]|nr:hypothetical protein K438DRAFT_1770219 [Mycena galopus ATCC 62051]